LLKESVEFEAESYIDEIIMVFKRYTLEGLEQVRIMKKVKEIVWKF